MPPKPVQAGLVSGLTIDVQTSFAQALRDSSEIDTLIVSGGHGTTLALEDHQLLEYVRTAAQRARRTVSICTGAMILAKAGLLDGKRVSTHWWWCPILEQRYPLATV
ncbi:MAG: DJ-1/PfpI family protein [Aliishimia sp.]